MQPAITIAFLATCLRSTSSSIVSELCVKLLAENRLDGFRLSLSGLLSAHPVERHMMPVTVPRRMAAGKINSLGELQRGEHWGGALRPGRGVDIDFLLLDLDLLRRVRDFAARQLEAAHVIRLEPGPTMSLRFSGTGTPPSRGSIWMYECAPSGGSSIRRAEVRIMFGHFARNVPVLPSSSGHRPARE